MEGVANIEKLIFRPKIISGGVSGPLIQSQKLRPGLIFGPRMPKKAEKNGSPNVLEP
jgi:hypothetical protein